MFGDLYRMILVVVGLLATLAMVFVLDLVLNCFAATRYMNAPPGE